jgi:hypothetical protein
MEEFTKSLELGTWIGKGQVFGLIAKGCSAAQAECLRRMREMQLHNQLDLTWEEFCPKYLGCSRATADNLIRNLETLGADYFRLSEVVRISPKTYRRIQSAVRGENLEIGGQLVPIVPQNSARIRSAILKLKSELDTAKETLRVRTSPGIGGLMERFNLCFEEMRRMIAPAQIHGETVPLASLGRYAIEKLKKIVEDTEYC